VKGMIEEDMKFIKIRLNFVSVNNWSNSLAPYKTLQNEHMICAPHFNSSQRLMAA
jgi:hypothetical protein